MSDAIEVLLDETRTFPPPEDFAKAAHISSEEQYEAMWQQAKDDPETFWGELAKSELDWFQPFESVMQGDMPDTKWFGGGTINACHNCVDRHLDTWRKNKAAIVWEGEPGDQRVLTYQDLARETAPIRSPSAGVPRPSGRRRRPPATKRA